MKSLVYNFTSKILPPDDYFEQAHRLKLWSGSLIIISSDKKFKDIELGPGDEVMFQPKTKYFFKSTGSKKQGKLEIFFDTPKTTEMSILNSLIFLVETVNETDFELAI